MTKTNAGNQPEWVEVIYSCPNGCMNYRQRWRIPIDYIDPNLASIHDGDRLVGSPCKLTVVGIPCPTCMIAVFGNFNDPMLPRPLKP
jgi:hypothetical protein